VDVLYERQGLIQRRERLGGFMGGRLDPSTGLGPLSLYTRLLGLEDVFIDAAAVEELEELFLLVLEVSQLALVAFGLLAGRI
jgi:hypothetical protein